MMINPTTGWFSTMERDGKRMRRLQRQRSRDSLRGRGTTGPIVCVQAPSLLHCTSTCCALVQFDKPFIADHTEKPESLRAPLLFPTHPTKPSSTDPPPAHTPTPVVSPHKPATHSPMSPAPTETDTMLRTLPFPRRPVCSPSHP